MNFYASLVLSVARHSYDESPGGSQFVKSEPMSSSQSTTKDGSSDYQPSDNSDRCSHVLDIQGEFKMPGNQCQTPC